MSSNKTKNILKMPVIDLFDEVEVPRSVTRSEQLFDQMIAKSGPSKTEPIPTVKTYCNRNRKPLSSMTSNTLSTVNKTVDISLSDTEANGSKDSDFEPSAKTSRTRMKKAADKRQNRVKWADSPEKRVSKKTQKRNKDYPNPTKESMLDAWDKAREAGLPDFDEIARYQLHVSKYTDRADPPTPPMHEIMAPFADLLPEADLFTTKSYNADTNDSVDWETEDNSHNVSDEVFCDKTNEKKTKVSVPKEDVSIGLDIVEPSISDLNNRSNQLTRSLAIEDSEILCVQSDESCDQTFMRNNELSSVFNPAVNSTPLVRGKYELIVDRNNFDASMSKMCRSFSSSVFEGMPKTTRIIPVFENTYNKGMSRRNRLSKVSKVSDVYHMYRKSIASVHSIYNQTSQPFRTVIQISNPNQTLDSVFDQSVRNVFDNQEELKKCMNQSLSTSLFATSKLTKNDKSLVLTPKQKVLLYCSPNEVIDFKSAFDKKILDKCHKVGEGSYGEVFASKDSDGNDIVVKIIPLVRNENQSEDDIFAQILPELVISLNFNRLRTDVGSNSAPNFINMIKSNTIKGKFPNKLIQEWDKFHAQRISENEDPRHYTKDQLYVAFFLANGGQDFEHYDLSSANESLSVFAQLALALAAAEKAFEFEHRDLHWGNVLIAQTEQKSLEYTIDGRKYTLRPNGVIASIIDFSLSRMTDNEFIIFDDLVKYNDLFEGVGDYQFDIYRMMRQLNGDNWQRFVPKTNIYWLHYMLDKAIAAKKYTKWRTNAHKSLVQVLKRIKDSILDFDSTTELIESQIFSQCLERLE